MMIIPPRREPPSAPIINARNFRRWCLKMHCLLLIYEDRKKGLS